MTHGALSLTAPAIRSENALERFAAALPVFPGEIQRIRANPEHLI